MRIAILADIHGNLPAFEAAVAHARGQRPDVMVIAGDVVVGGPESEACWELAVSLGCPILRGNHERYVYDFDTPAGQAAYAGEQYGPVRWAARQVPPAAKEAMRRLPSVYKPPGAPGTLVVHASPRADRDGILAHTPAEEIEAMFRGVDETWVFRAHNHSGQTRLWRDKTIVTVGSVGLPLDGYAAAQYVTADRRAGGWEFRHHLAPYDVDAAVRRFEETGYLDAAGPMARLYRREVLTATMQIVPFLKMFESWKKAGPISLDAAFERFVSSYVAT